MIFYPITVLLLAAFLLLLRFRVFIYVLVMLALFCGLTEIMGTAKPVKVEWRSVKSLTVISYQLEEKKAIYVWYSTKRGPVAYRYPWNINMAKALQRAFKRKRKLGDGTIKAIGPFDDYSGRDKDAHKNKFKFIKPQMKRKDSE